MAGADATTFALFRIAAGPRIGHGHLRRAEVLARALGRPARVSIRGAGAGTSLTVVPPAAAGDTLDAVRPRVLILDDPDQRQGGAWVSAAARRRVPVVSLHDLGLGRVASTLAVDGSVASPLRGWPATRTVRGLAYVVIAPPGIGRRGASLRRVLVSLGGGPRRRLTLAVARELAARHPDLAVLVTQAGSAAHATGDRRVRHAFAPAGLTPWLARVDMAIVGGGMSLYEAVAAGVPTVSLAVVPAQRPTVRAFAARRLTVDGGAVAVPVRPRLVARRVVDRFDRLVKDADLRRFMAQAGPRAIDGRGASRVARAILGAAEGATRA